MTIKTLKCKTRRDTVYFQRNDENGKVVIILSSNHSIYYPGTEYSREEINLAFQSGDFQTMEEVR